MTPFGLSSGLFHQARLTRDHLKEVASAGFTHLDLRATASHFDYRNPATIADLQEWLAAAGLTLHAVHAPVAEGFLGNRYVNPFNLASPDNEQRRIAVHEAELALLIARRIPFDCLVLHLGLVTGRGGGSGENSRDAARRSIEDLHASAEPLGVRLAVELIPNELSRAASLVHFIEDVVDLAGVGICLDTGHAALDGDAADAIEVVSEHLFAVEAADTRGRADDHLLPFEGRIDWPSTLTTLQKVGFEGVITLEPAAAAAAATKGVLAAAQRARRKMESYLEV
jgi:sugar phosphate isomerase/epimerase